MKSGLTAFTLGQVIGPDRIEPLGMAYPICEPVLFGFPQLGILGPWVLIRALSQAHKPLTQLQPQITLQAYVERLRPQ